MSRGQYFTSQKHKPTMRRMAKNEKDWHAQRANDTTRHPGSKKQRKK